MLCSAWQRAVSPVWRVGSWRLMMPARAFTSHPQKFIDSEDHWRAQDAMPRSWELIYRGPMDNVINAFSTFLTASTAVLAGVGVYYYTSPHDPSVPIMLADSDVVLANDMNEFMIYVVSFIALHTVVKIFISRFVIRMYKNEEKYVAVFRGHLYNQIKKHEFHVKDFAKLKPSTLVPWGESRCMLGTRKGILLEDYFKTPRHFSLLFQNKDTAV